ncbi:MAG TPA: universal stress protein, partial [Pirellulales bacterium]|nr:universal stress protein [Pirellulales bacterium]
LHVYPADDAYVFALEEAEELDIAKKRRRQRRQTIELLRTFVAELALPVEPILRVERGEPWRWIVSTASRVGADLTVMGTLGRGGVEGMLIGNTAEKVLHSNEGSVLAVKPEGFVSPVRPARKAVTA